MWNVDHLFQNLGRLLIVAAAGILAGCGNSSTADISGTIKLNGKAPDLEGLQINFMGKDGRPVAAEVSKDGTFRATGVPLGEVQVSLSYTPPEAIAAMERIAKSRLESSDDAEKGPGAKFDPKLHGPESKGYRQPAYKNPIPERLRDPRTSGKTIRVEADKENVFTWDVRR
jgi:hypothetical protein